MDYINTAARLALILLLIAPGAEAKERRKKTKKARETVVVTRTFPIEDRPTKRRYFSTTGTYLFWQEAITLVRGSSTTKMQTQLKGLSIGFDYHIPRRASDWEKIVGVDLSFGTLKGKGESVIIPDVLDNQFWWGTTFRAGLVYNTTPVSRFGVYIPAVYRKIQWKFNAGSDLKAKDEPYSFGIGAIYQNRFTDKLAMNITLSHQHSWRTSIWAFGMNWAF